MHSSGELGKLHGIAKAKTIDICRATNHASTLKNSMKRSSQSDERHLSCSWRYHLRASCRHGLLYRRIRYDSPSSIPIVSASITYRKAIEERNFQSSGIDVESSETPSSVTSAFTIPVYQLNISCTSTSRWLAADALIAQ